MSLKGPKRTMCKGTEARDPGPHGKQLSGNSCKEKWDLGEALR